MTKSTSRASLAGAQLETRLQDDIFGHDTTRYDEQYPTLADLRRKESLSEPVDVDLAKSDTVLYLAYGSNLCDETFLGKRGIRPLSATNVVVPDLKLTFDLPGIPYSEPCFANSARRPHKDSTETPLSSGSKTRDYHKNRWTKGLVGVVYEVTKTDYSTIIATEGGGASYNDILIDCYPLSDDQNDLVPEVPTSTAFKAHTLFAPADPTTRPPTTLDAPLRRPDPSYAQPSARYLKLITDGAKQRQLPYEYQRFLGQIRPYTITKPSQRIGMFVLMTIWSPFILLVFGLSKMFAGKDGRAPGWIAWLFAALFRAVWISYDDFFKPIFGDGERSLTDNEDLTTLTPPLEKHSSSQRSLNEKASALPK
ncbi:hypothetical protein KVT40_008603 [Elsinoe batatas]|uniref:gamma-glutamylcyclotransferase n=1 Tax=Elsinoe batatas TaxID=2601811 RepID=A0A8K0PCK0_9PEZI|nr:hypothetical protein KVT40_008603 [Elsinoe batatas]